MAFLVNACHQLPTCHSSRVSRAKSVIFHLIRVLDSKRLGYRRRFRPYALRRTGTRRPFAFICRRFPSYET